MTKIGSRRVIQWAALIMILQGVINKFGAIFIMIPDPVVGGLFCVMFGMITAFGLSALQYVDLRSSRNLYIIGLSLFFPLVLCQWMQQHPDAINTGIEELDSTLTVLLSTTILVGGCLGCLLDNLIPGIYIQIEFSYEVSERRVLFIAKKGSREERGLIAWEKEMSLKQCAFNENEPSSSTFDFPFGMNALRR